MPRHNEFARDGIARRSVSSCGALLLAALLGCSSEPPRETVYPVHGRLLIDGDAPPGALVSFHADHPIAGANPTPFGIVTPDGTYRPSTYLADDGLPAGTYRVTVVWPQMIEIDGLKVPAEDRLQGRFADPGAPVATVTINPETRQLPDIELSP